jgi:putative membrane protein
VTPAADIQGRAHAVPETDPRIYLAAERTLLAWIRTGLAMMGFGFVVARFALYLGDLPLSAAGSPVRPAGISLWFGTALVLMAVFVTLSAAFTHTRLVRRLRSGTWSPDQSSRSGTAVAVVLALVGVVVVVHLLRVPPA